MTIATSLHCSKTRFVFLFFVFSKRRRSPPALSEEEQEARVLLMKEWTRFKLRQERAELGKAQIAERTRSAALAELKELCPDLYEEAVKVRQRGGRFSVVDTTFSPSKRSLSLLIERRAVIGSK